MSEARRIEAADSPLVERYADVRRLTETLCRPLAIEDYVVQGIPEASPPKWHLAHTAWFFETFVLRERLPGYRSIDDRYEMFFNSYYVHVSDRVPQDHRGIFSRPTVEDVYAYRASVDAAVSELLTLNQAPELYELIELGLHHEQQHQELLVMDIKAHLNQPPFFPRYRSRRKRSPERNTELEWQACEGGLVEIGHDGESFAWDNERPKHLVYLEPFEVGTRSVTNREWLQFMEAGGYDDARLWLSDGWSAVRSNGWRAPMYWYFEQGAWHRFTLEGLIELDLDSPVCHVSYYEAEAYARWSGHRLPTEVEWEAFARVRPGAPSGAFLEDDTLDPVAVDGSGARGIGGNVWEWTASAYCCYPGYRQPPAAFGEYNAKFMVNQKVLRGGCCATPRSHYRATYRNFFYPDQRWAFSGVRLAR